MNRGQTSKKKKTRYHDLDHLSGLWSQEEADTFDKSLKIQRQVDAALWKKSGDESKVRS